LFEKTIVPQNKKLYVKLPVLAIKLPKMKSSANVIKNAGFNLKARLVMLNIATRFSEYNGNGMNNARNEIKARIFLGRKNKIRKKEEK